MATATTTRLSRQTEVARKSRTSTGADRETPPPPPVCHSVRLLFLYGALDSRPFFPSRAASGRCVLSAAAAGALAGVVAAFAEPSGRCAGAVLGCAVCVLTAPSSWRTGGCAGCCGGRLTVFAVHTPPSSGRPQPASLRFREHVHPPPLRCTEDDTQSAAHSPGSPLEPASACHPSSPSHRKHAPVLTSS